ncbi:tannase [Penicillium argentinense]|uniref:Carboxylic ester hydrolase n=1 Tax=Penicillium argentinense TaxID=1131581 RepID=A0A9W9FEL5_9EURO|nr:tannase [Penicillium argentinense]KAJ5098810.1 tannase [Penicillium argentinense]
MMILVFLWASISGAASVFAASLEELCTTFHTRNTLLKTQFQGLTLDQPSVTSQPVYNSSTTGQIFWPDYSGFDFCNVTFSYSHNGLKQDKVLLEIWLPAPKRFQNRWLSTGGGGYAINSEEESLPGGVIYGAASGQTDGGFGSFGTTVDEVILLANGTLNREVLYMHGYQAHHELSMIGKAFTRHFYDMADSEKLFAYYQGCSEGGREGWSQIQRFPDEWDGAVIGAPAIHLAQQQVNLLYGNIVQQTKGYVPPPCELEKINNLTIDSCDALDGRVDGVVSRTDLCKLHFDIESTIGASYFCPHSKDTSLIQNGTVSSKGVAVAKKILDGLHTIDGRRAYIWAQPSATFDYVASTFNPLSHEWEPEINSLSGGWVTKFLELRDVDNLSDLDDVTYDTLVEWMKIGWQRYEDVLQTTWPDLSPFQETGGKIIHYHGESDPGIPAGSSVHYHESVREIMYPDLSFEESTRKMNGWNRLYLIPGAGHCSYSSSQPNGPFPQTTLKTLIDWVEKGHEPDKLNATVLQGSRRGTEEELCAWPLRPLWKGNDSHMDCVFDLRSYDTWRDSFDAYKLPLY